MPLRRVTVALSLGAVSVLCLAGVMSGWGGAWGAIVLLAVAAIGASWAYFALVDPDKLMRVLRWARAPTAGGLLDDSDFRRGMDFYAAGVVVFLVGLYLAGPLVGWMSVVPGVLVGLIGLGFHLRWLLRSRRK